jgi:glycolate oxidase FAD binding subunit
MSAPLDRPKSEAELVERVAGAARAGEPLEIVGGRSKQGAWGPVGAARAIDVTGRSGITLYEPNELVIGAAGGTPVASVAAALEDAGQMLAFEPADYRAILGNEGSEPTIGGLVATNVSGPRRIVAGACRDALIGIRFVNGRGELIKSGGRVMKNVTGYDLGRLLAGSWGTLGIVTEAVFKVVPRPETSATLAWSGLADDDAIGLMSAALGSPYEVSSAAHVPAKGNEKARTTIRVENFAPSVLYRRDRLARELARFGPCDMLDADASTALWAGLRDVAPLAGSPGAVWRISVAPSKAAGILRAIGSGGDVAAFYDWGGGLVWLAAPETPDIARSVITAGRTAGGHAMLLRASADHRRATAPFLLRSGPIAGLATRVKAAFDPAGILNPGAP